MSNKNSVSEIYLDANATTQVIPEAAQAARDAMEDLYGNPSSSHISGLRARNILESTRDLARQVLGAAQGQVVFTSGATEAIQMGVFSAMCHAREMGDQAESTSQNRLLLYASTEHKAVPQAIAHWNRLLAVNAEVLEIPVDQHGALDLEFIAKHAARASLICTMAVNNETGVITDLGQVESAIRSSNPTVPWLVDCVQAIGKLEFKLSDTTIDYATISGHKMFAPKGIGLLYARQSAPLVPLLAGGGQEDGARGGTENLPGVAAIASVLQRLAQSPGCMFADPATLANHRDRIVDALKKAFPGIVFNTPFEHSVPSTINFSVRGFPSKELLDLFDAAGIRVSSGSACGSGAQRSYVLDAMGLEAWRSEGAIRMSFGATVSQSEIDSACQRIEQVGQALSDTCMIVRDQQSDRPVQQFDGLIQLKSGSNCTWLLMDSKTNRCVVIDPFEEMANRVENLVRCQNSQVIAILDSHAHVDHDSCRVDLLQSLAGNAADSATTNDLLGWPESADQTCILDDGSTATWMPFSSQWVIAKTDLPGHTVVGVAYLVGQLDGDRLPAENIRFAFTGDMILIGGIGRTDFPCSSIEKMYDSMQRLPQLISPTTILCPTHDYNSQFATTLAAEISENDFLQTLLDPGKPMSLEDFKSSKPSIDAAIADESNSELVCGLIGKTCDAQSSVDLNKAELESLLVEQPDCLIIDVREPHEFAFEQQWDGMGVRELPMNIPLTRLSGFLPVLLSYADQDRQIVFVCRSGRRSSKAAEVARRLGVNNARHIAGGLALNTLPVGTRYQHLAELEYMI